LVKRVVEPRLLVDQPRAPVDEALARTDLLLVAAGALDHRAGVRTVGEGAEEMLCDPGRRPGAVMAGGALHPRDAPRPIVGLGLTGELDRLEIGVPEDPALVQPRKLFGRRRRVDPQSGTHSRQAADQSHGLSFGN